MNVAINRLEIGIDDTDSLKGGCTTFVAYNVIKRVGEEFKLQVSDYPYLVRLNPNYPPKTKGNGAVKMSFELRDGVNSDEVVEAVVDVVRRYSRIDEVGTEPAVAIAIRKVGGKDLTDFYRSTLVEVVSPQRAIELADKLGITLLFLKDSNKGGVGSLAALGADLFGDHTYELLAYRDEAMWGKPRKVDEESVISMDRETSPLTFNNYDYANERVLVAPHGPDPILVGIRGETPDTLLKALAMLRFQEPLAGYAMFKSNQGTDAHFDALRGRPTRGLIPYSVACFSGRISHKPETIRGGHVLFSVEGESGEIPVVCFAESGGLTKTVRKLEVDDVVDVYGGTRVRGRSVCLNLERLDLIEVAGKRIVRPPACPDCGKRCKSKGLRQGYACPKCGRTFRRPQVVAIDRNVGLGTHLPDPGAMRHLSKPLSRRGLEKAVQLTLPVVDGWFK